MKMVIIEPLGVEEGKLLAMAKESLGDRVEIVYYNTKTTDTAELIERGKDAEIIVVSNLPLNAQVIEGCRNLKLLAVAFTGVDHIAMDVCRKNGVMVCNCAGYSTCAVADLVFGMLISLYRNVIPCDKVCREEGTKDGLVGFELEGKKFGVIGAGAIGQRVLKIAQAFGCETYAYNRSPKEIPGVQFVTMEELLKTCDIISVHVPQTKETIGLIGEEQFDMMKDTALFINTARGPIVDSEALAKALNEGQIAGAAVDVFEVEPPVAADHVLFGAKNLIATPHVAFASQQAFEKRAVIVAENIKCWINGNMQNVIC